MGEAEPAGASRVRLRRLPIDTYREAVAFLPRNSIACRPGELQALEKIELGTSDRRILATLNVIDHDGWLAKDELGLSEPAFALLGLPEGSEVELEQALPPRSLHAVHAKIRGAELSAASLDGIIRDIAGLRYSKMELAAFVVACAGFLSTAEVLNLTRAMAAVGTRLRWGDELVVDKHCIGGIPGNRTSMIIVPIVAAHGLAIPKTSSRAITSPAGTADTMEVLARVDLDIEAMHDIVAAEKGCLAWGGHVKLSPADDVLISVERPLNIDAPGQLVASILSKKLAAGAKRLVIDIPVGPTAKVRSAVAAIELRKLFEYVAREIDLPLEVAITDGGAPVGRGIGPVLEARDVMRVLANAPDAPADLRERALMLAGRILEFDPALRGGAGLARARELLASGAALAKMERIMAAQGRPPESARVGPLSREVTAPADGVVTALDCHRLARLARLAGAPADKGAGIDLLKTVGDRVVEGEPLYRIHACLPVDFRIAGEEAAEDSGVRLAPAEVTR
ncbi:MAG TPA: thymidine phosphorylase family protein [Stellaceae bacterium]|nr:thymidine phosphorylase family protein [Stellaceae bacterium]